MSEEKDIPILTDLISSGPEFTMSDLGLDEESATRAAAETQDGDLAFDADDAAPIAAAPMETEPPVPAPPDYNSLPGVPGALASNATSGAEISPALEQTVRRILDEHMELAWQEIRLAIQQHLERS